MKYALGNMLNGAGGLNADQLALDLPFAVTKSLTAAKGPTPTFTRASSGTFVGSNGLIQSAGNNVARFDHDPVTLASRGLLIEESRTNLLPNSQNIPAWTRLNSTLGSTTTSPDGTANATEVVFQTATASPLVNSNIYRQATASLTAGTIVTASVYVKSASNTTINLAINGVSTGTNNSASVVNVTTSWTRVSATFTLAANDTGLFLVVGTGVDGTNNQKLTARTIELWGAQLELGSFATSYIPTTTASVVRSADVCSISGAAFTGLWAGEATVLFSAMRYQALATTASRSWALHSGTQATEIYGGKFGTQELLAIAGSSIFSTGTIIPAFQQFKTAHAIKATDYAGSQNGLAAITSNNATSITPNAFNIGSSFANGSQLNGTISAIRYYRKRLDNAKLQALTAP